MISGCEYTIYNNNYEYKNNLPIIHLYSHDPYGYMTMMIKEKLYRNNVLYIDCKKRKDFKKYSRYENLPYISVHIINISEQYIKTALFQNGETAGYQLILTIKVKMKTHNNKSNSFNIIVSRSFFNNPLTISANLVKENNIREILYQEATEKLIHKIFLFIKMINN